MMKANPIFFACIAAALTLTACRVETSSESVPEAEGNGKKAINIRVEPMSRDEIKSAADKAIDKTADAATQIRSAATTAVQNLQTVGRNVTTLTDTMIDIHRSTDANTTSTP